MAWMTGAAGWMYGRHCRGDVGWVVGRGRFMVVDIVDCADDVTGWEDGFEDGTLVPLDKENLICRLFGSWPQAQCGIARN